MPFIVGHLIDNEVLPEFLQAECGDPDIKGTTLCAWKDRLPKNLTAFLWEEGGLLDSAGGWEKSDPELRLIVGKLMSNPRYFSINLARTLQITPGQMGLYETGGDLIPHGADSECAIQIRWRVPAEHAQFMSSKQQQGKLQEEVFSWQNPAQRIFNYVCAALALVLLLPRNWRMLNPLARWLIIYTMLMLVFNAFVVCALNSPTARFQNRVMCLPGLAVMLACFSFIPLFISKESPRDSSADSSGIVAEE